MRERTSSVALVLVVFAIVAGVYAATHQFRGTTDTRVNSLQTRALVLHGDIDLARYGLVVDDFQTSQEKLIVARDDRLYSIYGIGVSIVAAPVYAVTSRAGVSEGTSQGIVAVLFAAGAVALMGALLRQRVSPIVAATCLVGFAFGTTVWPVASTALFQQGPLLFFECVGLLGVLGSRPRLVVAGVGFGMATLIRPTAAIVLAIVGLYYLLREWRRAVAYFAGAAAPLAALAVQNRWIWGSWIKGGYSYAGVTFGAPFGQALGGLTIGWWRGFLVYSPFLAFGLAGWILALRRRDETESALAFLGISVLVTLLLYAKWADWGGGINQFGYRLQLDFVPAVIVLAAYGLWRVPTLLPAGLFAALVSALTMTFGVARRRDGFDDTLFAHTTERSSLWRAWRNFFDHPGPGAVRFVLVAVASALLVAIVRRLHPADPSAMIGTEG
jgi:hypothetical protein